MNDIKVTDAAAVPGSAALLVQNGDKAFMYDTGFGFCAEEMADTVEKILDGKKPDAIILTHSHYDHVMGCAVLADRWKDIPVIAGEYTAYVFTRPTALKTIYEMDVNAAHELDKKPYLTDCTDRLHVDKVVKDGEVIDVCGLKLETMAFPGHTKCSIGFYCRESKTLFSSETLGVYNGTAAAPILLTGFKQGEQSLKKAAALGAEHIVLPHWGMLDGAEECRKYFENALYEFEWTKNHVIDLHNSGMSDHDIIEELRKRYHIGHMGAVYPMKAFYLNTGYMVPLIIKEYCAD